MPDSRVISAEIDGEEIVLDVDVAAFADGETVEVSGCATQAYGADGDGGFATFSETQKINKPYTREPAKLKVRAKLTKDFEADQDITFVVRVAKVWITVLSQETPSQGTPSQGSSAEAATPGRKRWNSLKGVGGPDDFSSTQGGNGQTAASASSAPSAASASSAPSAG